MKLFLEGHPRGQGWRAGGPAPLESEGAREQRCPPGPVGAGRGRGALEH